MATDTDVANFALGMIGEGQITSLTEASEAAEACNLWFTTARRRSLRASNWTCAIKRVTISPDAAAPNHGPDARFKLPADYIRLVSIDDARAGREYTIESGYLLTDQGPSINISYVFDETDVSQYDEELVQFFATALAFYICLKLTQSKKLRTDLEATLNHAETRAKNIDSAGQSPQQLQAGSWITGRTGGGDDPTKWFG